jgi:hypothetical protein
MRSKTRPNGPSRNSPKPEGIAPVLPRWRWRDHGEPAVSVIPTAKRNLDDALAIRPPRPAAIRCNLDRHHCAAFDFNRLIAVEKTLEEEFWALPEGSAAAASTARAACQIGDLWRRCDPPLIRGAQPFAIRVEIGWPAGLPTLVVWSYAVTLWKIRIPLMVSLAFFKKGCGILSGGGRSLLRTRLGIQNSLSREIGFDYTGLGSSERRM